MEPAPHAARMTHLFLAFFGSSFKLALFVEKASNSARSDSRAATLESSDSLNASTAAGALGELAETGASLVRWFVSGLREE